MSATRTPTTTHELAEKETHRILARIWGLGEASDVRDLLPGALA
jgi:hypothetical protein